MPLLVGAFFMQERTVKFLPFVVDKSTPLHIFQTLVTRSKGMNEVLVASILYLVLQKGILLVRETASKLPEMELDKLYEVLLNTYPSYRIETGSFNRIQSLKHHVENFHADAISGELREYSMSDIMSFLLVMELTGNIKDFTSLNICNLFNGQSDEAEVDLLDNYLFSNTGDKYKFSSRDDVAAYVWCHTILSDEPTGVLPVYAQYSTDEHPKAKSKKKPSEKKTRFDKNKGQSYTEFSEEAKSKSSGYRGSSKKRTFGKTTSTQKDVKPFLPGFNPYKDNPSDEKWDPSKAPEAKMPRMPDLEPDAPKPRSKK